MNYQVLGLETPKKLCVICQEPAESCQQGNHICDTIGYSWVVIDEDSGNVASFHFTRNDAKRALRAMHDSTD